MKKKLHLYSLYRGVRPGDRYTAACTPGTGTRLWLNYNFPGAAEGSEFALPFFAARICENHIDKSLRDRMLGVHGP
ncbi:MAG: chalcone isomerase family protein [Desulfosalsimonas sp.]